jgi:hypothetical protein
MMECVLRRGLLQRLPADVTEHILSGCPMRPTPAALAVKAAIRHVGYCAHSSSQSFQEHLWEAREAQYGLKQDRFKDFWKQEGELWVVLVPLWMSGELICKPDTLLRC